MNKHNPAKHRPKEVIPARVECCLGLIRISFYPFGCVWLEIPKWEQLCFDSHRLWNKSSFYFCIFSCTCLQDFCFRIYIYVSNLVLICIPRFVSNWLFPTWLKIILGSPTDVIYFFIARQYASVDIFSVHICTQSLMFSFYRVCARNYCI